ncbi:copper transport protein [Paenibacillus phyllosphaerae]|uniref:Copper transport protein n=1 Tax=Paenibacillus phyllosphaerae TaxID=274593 RepID=A0A7W5B4N1_9BACL|nr:copper resistance protein CopC [Paenibacillus phyllosphaerae]MBB3114360.1 copper transport protein [Paenibacillus phyllosphaerae]
MLLLLLLTLATGLLLSPGQALAHATLEAVTPEAGQRMDESPPFVELTFNEPIESKLGALRVLDRSSNPVTDNDPVLGTDRTTLKLALPELGEGVYTVSYSIISEDGHPVSGSYVFIVGNPPEAVDASNFNVHTQLGGKQFILYAVRIAYYAGLLLAAGLLLWSSINRADGESISRIRRKWELPVMRGFLVAVLLYVFVQATETMKGYPTSEYLKLFGQTDVGRGWIILIGLAAIGFPVLKLGRAVRLGWVALILALESWSGHAIVFSPKAMSVLFDLVHLAASSLWAGGLVLLLVIWISDRKEAGRFAEVFSSFALLSLVVLTISGVGMTFLFLPSLDYLLYTAWGKLLIAKTAFVVLVLIIGALLRLRVRRGDLPNYTLLRIDFGLMAIIVAIAAIFTYISPLPANEPISYHKMGNDMHMTIRISPNKPSVDNTFNLKIWLPNDKGPAKSVVLRLKSLDKPELGAIDVPLTVYTDEELSSFDGYVKEAFKAEGPYLPFAGKWQAEIRVINTNDDELVERYEFRNY